MTSDTRLPAPLVRFLQHPAPGYSVRIGRGPGASPELYAAGPGFLLSAGGAGNPWDPEVVPRPTVLLLDDGAAELYDVVRLEPSGPYRKWNATGVLPGIAVGRGTVRIPASWEADARCGIWSVYRRAGTWIAVAQAGDTGVLTVGGDRSFSECAGPAALCAKDIAEWLHRSNPAEQLKSGLLTAPDGRVVAFDVRVPCDRWVIRSVDGVPVDRNLASWPRLCGWGLGNNNGR